MNTSADSLVSVSFLGIEYTVRVAVCILCGGDVYMIKTQCVTYVNACVLKGLTCET